MALQRKNATISNTHTKSQAGKTADNSIAKKEFTKTSEVDKKIGNSDNRAGVQTDGANTHNIHKNIIVSSTLNPMNQKTPETVKEPVNEHQHAVQTPIQEQVKPIQDRVIVVNSNDDSEVEKPNLCPVNNNKVSTPTFAKMADIDNYYEELKLRHRRDGAKLYQIKSQRDTAVRDLKQKMLLEFQHAADMKNKVLKKPIGNKNQQAAGDNIKTNGRRLLM